jgi:hypothetical protein
VFFKKFNECGLGRLIENPNFVGNLEGKAQLG